MGIELYNLIVSTEKKNEYKEIMFMDFNEDKRHNVIAELDFFKRIGKKMKS